MQNKESQRSSVKAVLETFADNRVAEEAEYEYLGGHASLRIYWRIHLPEETDTTDRDESTLMAMVLMGETGGSEEGPETDESADIDKHPFIDVQEYLSEVGISVPQIDYVDMDEGVLLLEDLGDTHFEDVLLETASSTEGDIETRKEAVADYYKGAIDITVELQEQALQTAIRDNPEDASIAFSRHFDRDELRWELDHYLEWGLKAQYGESSVEPYADELDQLFDKLVDEIADIPKTMVLRDYQSRNIMQKDGEWYLIDFQDALTGPYIYDVVSLLRDSYIAPDPDQIDDLIQYYSLQGESSKLPWCLGERNVWYDFRIQTIQRKLKDAGRFVYIDEEKGDSSFLQYYDRSIRFVSEALANVSGWERLREILNEVEPAFEIN